MEEDYIINSQNEFEQIYINTNSDLYVNNKYMTSVKDEKNNLNNNIGTTENNYSDFNEEQFNEKNNLKINNEDELNEINLPLKIDSERDKGIINNMIINDSPSKSPNYSTIENYVKMENLYIQDGKLNTSITNNNFYSSNNTFKNSTPNFLDSKRNSEIILKNEEKLKLLQDELTKKMGNNNLDDIKNFEIDDNDDFNSQLNYSISKDSESINNDNENIESKQKIRNEKENKIKENITKELRPKLFNEIYKKEYKNIYNKIKNEVEKEFKNEIDSNFNKQLSSFKKKQNAFLIEKENEIGNKIREKCENEMEIELNKELELKEKEHKFKFNQKLESFKKKIELDLKNKYEVKKQELNKEINAIKSKLYKKKSNEKVKINKINQLKNNIKIFSERNNKIVEKIDKIINSKDLEDDKLIQSNSQTSRVGIKSKINDNRNSISKGQSFIHLLNNNNSYSINDNRNSISKGQSFIRLLNNNNSYSVINPNYFNQTNKQFDDIFISSLEKSDRNLYRNPSNNSVNLKEINQQIKLNSGRSCKNIKNKKFICNDIDNKFSKNNYLFEQESISPINSKTNIFNNNINKNNNGVLYNIKKIINIKDTSPILSKEQNNFKRKKTYDKSPIRKNEKYITENIFYSIQIDKNIPITVSEFGKYLIKHIEKEEKYKILFNNELKSFCYKIKNIFDNSNSNDHCLTEYMLDLWNKLQISYYIRYQIMKKIIQFNSSNLYTFLDRETEYLINYYTISEKIFSIIEKRENIKLKLQIQSNRNELNINDQNKFNEISNKLENFIEDFKDKYKNVDIIWKGLRYQWFMNYEKWFYEMENITKR